MGITQVSCLGAGASPGKSFDSPEPIEGDTAKKIDIKNRIDFSTGDQSGQVGFNDPST